jgi:hypothetical protein
MQSRYVAAIDRPDTRDRYDVDRKHLDVKGRLPGAFCAAANFGS